MTNDDDQEETYTPMEAAERLHYGRSTFYKYMKEGLVETTKDARGRTRITAKALEDFRRRLPDARREQLIDHDRRRELGRIGGYANLAKHTPQEVIAPAMAGRWAALERQVDPEGKLDPAERSRRAEALMKSQLAKARAAKMDKALRYQLHQQDER